MPTKVSAAAPFSQKLCQGPVQQDRITRVAPVKSHSEKDVWQEVRKAERLHGDQAEVRRAQRTDELTGTKVS